MNAVGAYEDLDMRGIDPRWYSSVPVDQQTRFVAAQPAFRIVHNPQTGDFVVVVRDPPVSQEFGDGWLRGWSIAFNFPGRCDAEQILAFKAAKDKWTNGYVEKWAPVKIPGETIEQRVTRADDAVKAEGKRLNQQRSEESLVSAVEDYGNVLMEYVHGLHPLRGAKDAASAYAMDMARDAREAERRGRIFVLPGSR